MKLELMLLKVLVFEKSCIQNNCKTKKIKSKLEGELKLAILKKAALFEKDDFKKYKETEGEKKAKTILKKIIIFLKWIDIILKKPKKMARVLG